MFAVLVAHPDRHPTILTAHLPDLLAAWDSEPQWWFIRHHDPENHLRLRIRIPTAEAFGVAAQRVGSWARKLRQRGLVGHLRFETYHPETGRFGDGDAMTAAESVFAADSAAALAQLTATDVPRDAMIAASVVDLVTTFIGDIDDGLRWCLDHLPRTTQPGPARAFRDHAVRLANPHDQHTALQACTGGERITAAWARRRTALTAYRAALLDADDPDPDAVLPDLLHLHHARMAGISEAGERSCLHLARTAALSWTTRTRMPV